jgi:hypothetical protein
MGKTVEIELDAWLLGMIEARAARLGQEQSEVISDALRRGLEEGQLRAILDRGRKEPALSETEAMQLAIEELKLVRSERAKPRAT